jgi:hypothetical protein
MVLVLYNERRNQYGFWKQGERKDVIVNYYSLVRACSLQREEGSTLQARTCVKVSVELLKEHYKFEGYSIINVPEHPLQYI